MEAGQYTSIPTTEFDAKRNSILAQKEAESRKAWIKLNSLGLKAKEQQQNRSVVSKWLSARRQWKIMTFGALEKVFGSAVTKPIVDPLIKQTFGRISGAITGIHPTDISRIGRTIQQFKGEKEAGDFMAKMGNRYADAIIKYDRIEDKESAAGKQAFKELQDAEINHLISQAQLFINANSAIDIQQVMMKGATDFDAKMGKYKQSLAKERSKLEEAKFWIEAVNRTHSAMKSVSARQALMDGYIENLQYFQQKYGKVDDTLRQRAWDMATLSEYEQGRFGESTHLSSEIGKIKSSKQAWKRNAANYLLAIAKISINITKQGIDMAAPFIEAGVKTLGSDAFKGIKLNEQDGIEFKNFADKYYNGIKRGYDSLPLEQKKYINTLMSRGLFGIAQYGLVGYLLSQGKMKYGGSYDSSDPFRKHKVMGSDGKPLDYGEWEINGHRFPKILNLSLIHI